MEDIYQLDFTGIAGRNKQEQFLNEAEEHRIRLRVSGKRDSSKYRSKDSQKDSVKCCHQGEPTLDLYI